MIYNLDDYYFLLAFSAEGSFLDKFFKTTSNMTPMEVFPSYHLPLDLIFINYKLGVCFLVNVYIGNYDSVEGF